MLGAQRMRLDTLTADNLRLPTQLAMRGLDDALARYDFYCADSWLAAEAPQPQPVPRLEISRVRPPRRLGGNAILQWERLRTEVGAIDGVTSTAWMPDRGLMRRAGHARSDERLASSGWRARDKKWGNLSAGGRVGLTFARHANLPHPARRNPPRIAHKSRITLTPMSITLTDFARARLFACEPRRNTIQDILPEAFEQHLNAVPPLRVLDGYAPFCKLHVHRNWTSTRCLAVPITAHNQHLLRSGYEARSSDELPVLVRWFEGVEPPVADYLIVILYSREQLAKENTPIAADWGVVGCMYSAEPEETPMAPITMMRNALGVAEGGSGVAMDRAAYQRSVAFWNTHANWRG